MDSRLMSDRSLERRVERIERALRLLLERLDVDEAEIEELEEEVGQPSTFPQTSGIQIRQI
jgi:hypothetical protein